MMQWRPTFSDVGGDEHDICVSLNILSSFRQKHTTLEHESAQQSQKGLG